MYLWLLVTHNHYNSIIFCLNLYVFILLCMYINPRIWYIKVLGLKFHYWFCLSLTTKIYSLSLYIYIYTHTYIYIWENLSYFSFNNIFTVEWRILWILQCFTIFRSFTHILYNPIITLFSLQYISSTYFKSILLFLFTWHFNCNLYFLFLWLFIFNFLCDV